MTAVLHVISDRQNLQISLTDALAEAASGGADVIQIREKKWPAKEVYDLCTELQARLRGTKKLPKIFVNDRIDIALAAKTSGVHLAAKSLPLPIAKAVLHSAGWCGIVGISVHSLDEALEAEQAGADYITFGHIFASESHRGQPPRGIAALKRIVDCIGIPVIAIGGIQVQNVGPVLETGCSGVAVIGAVMHQASPLLAVKKLKDEMLKVSIQPKIPFDTGRL